MENDSVQKYVEIGSNMYVGTKDGIQYTLTQSSDNKLRLVEVRNESSIDVNASKRSFGSMLKDETFNATPECIMTPIADQSNMKLITLKSDSSSCKGQGDEIGNSILSTSHSISSLKDSFTTLDKTDLRENLTFMENSPQMTYATLTPRKAKLDAAMDNNDYFLTPQSTVFTSSPIFPTPLITRPSRYVKRQRMPSIPSNTVYSPIEKPRFRAPRGRRPKYAKRYQYNPQMLYSSNSSSTISSSPSLPSHDSEMSLSENKSIKSSGSFNTSQSSIEYPRVPNNTPTSATDSSENVFSVQWMPQIADQIENYMADDPRETHNEKERKRRRRIKIACQCMRELIPCVTEKTDNATVFELSVLFIEFVRDTLGGEDDVEFIERSYRIHDA